MSVPAIKLNQVVNVVYEPVFTQLGKVRYIILMGGRGAGRSTVVSQLLLALVTSANYFRCAIMRFILSDVRNSIYREITDRAEEQGVKEALYVTDNTMKIEYGQNSINAVGFRKSSSDQKSKLKSLANYTTVAVEEADEVDEEDFTQLDDSLRTTKGDITVVLCLNPPAKSHWIIRRWFDLVRVEDIPKEDGIFYKPKLKEGVDDVVFINTSYLDNRKNISDHTAANYEKYRETKPAHYWNMIRGYVPEVVRGMIYTNWKVIDAVPHEARLECYALDFGYHPDPAALVAIYSYNGGYIVDELLYQTDLLNRHLATCIKRQPEKAFVVADHAEPKSIAELKDEYDIDIFPCEKGADSVNYGIKKVQGMKISVTKRSTNIIKEKDKYAWKVNKDGSEESIEDPKCPNHAMSAIRYGLTFIEPTDLVEEREQEIERHNRTKERERDARGDAGL